MRVRRIILTTLMASCLIIPALHVTGGGAAFAADDVKAGAQTDMVADLPNHGKIQLNAQDVVLHADFESYVATEEDENGASFPLYAGDLFDLNNEMITYIHENFDAEEKASTAAYFYIARNKGFEHRLSLDEEQKASVLKELEDKKYDPKAVKFDEFSKLRDMYLSKHAKIEDEKKDIAGQLFDNMDVIGFIKLDQEGRKCALKSADKQKQCVQVQTDLLKVLDKPEFLNRCRDDSMKFMSGLYGMKSLKYANSYNAVVDHKTIKFIIEGEDYDREELREYMDGALMELYKRGFHPKDEKNMEIARGMHPMILRRCVALLNEYK